MITVWGRATSLNVQMVMWALAELNRECERINVGGAFGGNRTPDYLAMNPNGLVPVLRDGDGPFLWESAAIVRYLGASYGGEKFWPASPANRAVADRWAEWIKTTFGPAFLGGVFRPLIFVKPQDRDPDTIAAAARALEPLAAMLDACLAESPYIGGDAPCFADMIVGAPLYRYFTLDFDRAELPRLRAYYDRLAARPAYAAHVMISYDSLRAK